jgi:hypothetical protein
MNTGRIQSRKSESAASTLPEIGKIKIGQKHPEKGYPMSLDYFRATGNFANEFTQKYGDKPTRLSVCFISDNLQEVCNERFESWVKAKRWGWGDGLLFTVWDPKADGDKGKYVENLPPDDPRVKALKWDMTLTLRFVLLELRGIMGYWTFQTKAKATTIPSIVKSFDYVRERAGSIVAFPFSLLVEKKTGYSPGEAKNYPVVTLVPNFSEDAILLVSQYLEAGGNVNKLTTAMIAQKQVLQIEAGKGDVK